ncbi:hypothetical protein [Clostridioides difficile]|uniref:hypothetical protein n=1 Tax=Clostridioides difficile TaxID=1496 RepID=UPI00131CD763|nr:hypothetical protein [Clostridioides difficile]
MCFKTYILKRLVNNKQLEINRSFNLDNHLAIVDFPIPAWSINKTFLYFGKKSFFITIN